MTALEWRSVFCILPLYHRRLDRSRYSVMNNLKPFIPALANSNLTRGGLGEGVGDYVAELQLHMTLQARNLLPSLGHADGSGVESGRDRLLRETQAECEKLLSRQGA